jgi:hypothetical protein
VVHAHNAPGLDFLTAAQIGAGIDDFNADATSRPEFAAALGAAEAWIAEKAGIAPASNPERYAGGPDSDPSEFPASASDLLCGTTS